MIVGHAEAHTNRDSGCPANSGSDNERMDLLATVVFDAMVTHLPISECSEAFTLLATVLQKALWRYSGGIEEGVVAMPEEINAGRFPQWLVILS